MVEGCHIRLLAVRMSDNQYKYEFENKPSDARRLAKCALTRFRKEGRSLTKRGIINVHTIALLTTAICFLMAAVPPWRIQVPQQGVSVDAGYAFILFPPNPLAEVDLARLMAQVLMLAFLAFGLSYFLKGRRPGARGNQRQQEVCAGIGCANQPPSPPSHPTFQLRAARVGVM